MKLYLISQTRNRDYDSYDSAVVCALSEETARAIHPAGGKWPDYDSSWVNDREDITVKYIGESAEGIEIGVICASFNAG